MYKRLFFLIVAVFITIDIAYAQGLDWMPDPNLRKAVREEMSVPEGVPITAVDIANVVRLNVASMDIVDLTGLERFVNLENIVANRNHIQDLRPLAGLKNLGDLHLSYNNIQDLRPLAGLTNLAALTLNHNNISDISPLAELINLIELSLTHNTISDVSPLAGLVNLQSLWLWSNQIKDISALENLVQLETLMLVDNQIEDISPLVALTGLRELNVSKNWIVDLSPLGELSNIEILATEENPGSYGQDTDWMPDPELRQAVHERLNLPQGAPLIPLHLQELTSLIVVKSGISSLQGLEHAVNLRFLHITHSLLSDLTPLKDSVSLTVLKLWENEISDITPLVNLTNLEELQLSDNHIREIAPLSGLTNLQILDLSDNLIADITPLENLTSLEFLGLAKNPVDASQLLQLRLPSFRVCNIPGLPFKDRIENRDYPSVFSAWANIINLPTLSDSERYAYHDLSFGTDLGIGLIETDEGFHIIGNLEEAKRRRDTFLEQNPNMVFLAQVEYYLATPDEYPDDWHLWLRDEAGKRVLIDGGWNNIPIDFTLPETQKWTIDQAKVIAACGLFDGIFLDHWNEDRRLYRYRTLEEEHIARDRILQGIRNVVGDDFLIMANTNHGKIPRWAEYINGTFMETAPDLSADLNQFQGAGYTLRAILEIEETLIWSEKHFREPRINCLEGQGLIEELPDSPRNRQWMRLFTTMSLTLSDGYVLYTIGSASLNHEHFWYNSFLPESHDWHPHVHDHDHYWYDFYDVPLGRPVGEKGVLYQNREGLYIREYTNGWAAYNRSGTEQQIEFSEAMSGVASGVKEKRLHVLPDLDCEIYLKSASGLETPPTVYVNKDGV
ncbi:leucine-rich repeat domain-containing protein, partial [Candidatus Poribacteria bacterium]|nr:leucine-rich repeat domain-containing protein [Candidatus Poribacteria bacterium]